MIIRNYISIFIEFVLLLCPVILRAQINEELKLNSLELKIINENPSEQKALGLIALFESYKSIDTIKAKYFFNLTSVISKENNLNKPLIKLLIIEAEDFEKKFALYSALKKYMEALHLSTESIIENNQAHIYNKLSSNYLKVGNYNQAMILGLKSLSLNEKIKDSVELYISYLNLGNVHRYLHDYNKSFDYYSKSLEISRKIRKKEGEAKILNNIGITYKEIGNYELALEYYKRSYNIFKELAHKDGIACFYNNSGSIYLTKGDLDLAYNYFQKAFKIRIETGDKRNEANSYINFGDYFTLKKDYYIAVTNYQKGLSIANQYKFPEKEKEIYLKLSELYKKMNLFESSLNEYIRYNSLNDSLLNNSKRFEIARLEMKYQFDNEKLIKETTVQRKEQKTIILILGYTLILLFIFVLFLLVRLRLRKQIIYSKQLVEEKGKVELDLLEKNKEFAAHALNLAQKSELIKTISVDLQKNLNKESRKNQHYLKQIINKLDTENIENIWEDFEVRFLQVNNGFYENLIKKNPTITQNEKRLCAFLRLGMSTKEISLITGQSPHSINVTRTRLRYKLGLRKNEQSISDFLISF